jgi:hypothetical protein
VPVASNGLLVPVANKTIVQASAVTVTDSDGFIAVVVSSAVEYY